MTRSKSGGKAAGRGAGSGGGCKRAASKKTSPKKYTGVCLDKSTGRWVAQHKIGGKQTYLGNFGSEEEAARAWDRMRLWSCKGDGTKKVEGELNFPLSDYGDDEVTKLQGLTQEEMIKKLRRTGQEDRVANQTSKYTGVALVKRSGRWEAQCGIGGKKTTLGYFGSEDEAARAWDRMRSWRCKADGKKKEEVEMELNFPLSEYSDDEVTELQGFTQEEMIQKLRRTGQEERVANQTSKYTGVALVKSTGRWQAQCWVGGEQTKLGYFGSEDEAARAWDRARSWSCKADGKTKEEVKLNFPLSDYGDDEVTALQSLTQEEMIQKLRQKAKQSKFESKAKAVECPASPTGPGAAVGVKHEAADVVPAGAEVEAVAGQPPLKKIKVEEVQREEETHHVGGAVVEPAEEEDAGVDFNNNGSHEEAAEDVDAMAVVTPDRPRSSRVNKQPVPIKREDRENGLVRCPRCKGGVLASKRGCNIVTCRVIHEETLAGTFGGGRGGWCYFFFHCGVENNGEHCPSPLCPQRVDPEARAAAAAMHNEAAGNNPVDLRGD
jgi:hypothetical protein